MDGCEVTFDGSYSGTYHIPCDQVAYVNTDNLVNVGTNSTIYLYPDSVQSGRNNYISLPPLQYPRYYAAGSYNYTEITNASNVRFNGNGNIYKDSPMIQTGCYVILMAFCIISLLIKK